MGGSEDSRKGMEIALELARKFDLEVFLLSIIEQLPHYEVNIGEIKKVQTEKKKGIISGSN
jgi:hypothetical protein